MIEIMRCLPCAGDIWGGNRKDSQEESGWEQTALHYKYQNTSKRSTLRWNIPWVFLSLSSSLTKLYMSNANHQNKWAYAEIKEEEKSYFL